MGYKYPGCSECYFHDREPTICDNCEDESNFEPDEDFNDTDDSLALARQRQPVMQTRAPKPMSQAKVIAFAFAVAGATSTMKYEPK